MLAGSAVATDLEHQAARLLEQAVPDPAGPGLAVLVARGDDVLYRDARGMASIELGVPLSPDHVFRIGSVTKQFAAAGLLQLIDQGKLALDDPLSKFLPEFPNGTAITVAQLLNHTSGIRSYTNMPGHMDQAIRSDLDTSALIRVFENEAAEFAPGAGWNYNNSGYVLVGAVIEQVAKMPWARWLQRQQFQPLALTRTASGATRDLIPGHAYGYRAGGGAVQTAPPLSMTQPHAAGALVSTVDDLLRWNLALHGGKLLSEDSYRRMITPEGKAAETPNRYGYGIQVGTVRGHPVYEHGGGIFGFLSMLLYLPEQAITVVVLRNADGDGGQAVGTLARRLAALALNDPYPDLEPVAIAPEALKALEGVYRLDADNARTLRVHNGVLTSQRSGGRPFDLVPIGNDRFLFRDSLSLLRIERDEDGKPVAMVFFADGDGDGERWPLSDEAVDAAPVAIELSAQAQQRLLGQYVAEQLSFKVFIDDDGVLRIQVPGQPAFELKAQTSNQLFVREVDARFQFEPEEGPVEAATLIQGPARIRAERQPD